MIGGSGLIPQSFFLPPYAKAWFKPKSAELHRTRGTFWRKLYRLSYRAAAIPLSHFSWVRGPPTTTLLVFETLCSCITRDFDLSALSIELPRTRRRLSTLATWLTKTEFRETKHHSILERKKMFAFLTFLKACFWKRPQWECVSGPINYGSQPQIGKPSDTHE